MSTAWIAFEAMVATGLLLASWSIIRDLAKGFAWFREMYSREGDEE